MKTLYVAIGIPGAGKTTKMKELNALWVSSDAIRGELFGDENDQSNPVKVFAILNARIRKALKRGDDVIYDATNVSTKSRKQIFKDHAEAADKMVAYFIDTPLEEAIRRNSTRDRIVPNEVIERMYNNLNPPTLDEGFDEIVHIKTATDGTVTTTVTKKD